jgi:hypothetical protein
MVTKTMSMLNCIHFRIRFDFDEKIFDAEKFKKVATLNPDEPVRVTAATVDHNARDEHAHITVVIDGEDSFLTLNMYQGSIEIDPFETGLINTTQSRLKEITDSFKKTKLVGRSTSHFAYSDSSPAVILGYPATFPGLKDTIVSGQEYKIGKGRFPKRALVTIDDDDEISVLVVSSRSLNLSSFNPSKVIEQDSKIARSLVIQDYVDSHQDNR